MVGFFLLTIEFYRVPWLDYFSTFFFDFCTLFCTVIAREFDGFIVWFSVVFAPSRLAAAEELRCGAI